MEFLAFLYTVLLVAICLMMALLLYRSAKPTASRDDTELKEWLRQQLDAQNRQMEAKLAEMSQQNLAVIMLYFSSVPAVISIHSFPIASKKLSFKSFTSNFFISLYIYNYFFLLSFTISPK